MKKLFAIVLLLSPMALNAQEQAPMPMVTPEVTPTATVTTPEAVVPTEAAVLVVAAETGALPEQAPATQTPAETIAKPTTEEPTTPVCPYDDDADDADDMDLDDDLPTIQINIDELDLER